MASIKCCLIEQAEFVSIWDDGNTEIICPCTVDLLRKTGENSRLLVSEMEAR